METDRRPYHAKESPEQRKSTFFQMQEFVSKAVRLDLKSSVRQAPNQTNAQWARQWNILGTYLFVDHASTKRISEIYGLKNQKVYTIAKNAAKNLYEKSPEELKREYPITIFYDFRKPVLRRPTKEPQSKKRNEEVAKERARLSDPAVSQEEKQKILDSLGKGVLNRNTHIVRLADVLREAGLSIVGRSTSTLPCIIDTLHDAGFAARLLERRVNSGKPGEAMQRYGFIAQGDREAIVRYLQENADIQKRYSMKVQSLREKEMPHISIADMYKRQLFPLVSSAIDLYALRALTGRGIKLADLISDKCPVPVYRHRNIMCFREQDREIFVDYINKQATNVLNKIADIPEGKHVSSLFGVSEYSNQYGEVVSINPETLRFLLSQKRIPIRMAAQDLDVAYSRISGLARGEYPRVRKELAIRLAQYLGIEFPTEHD